MTKFNVHKPWPQIEQMHTQYQEQHGTQHPERQIDLATFKKRLDTFESVIDPWITGEGSREGSIRRWCKANSVKLCQGRGSFTVLFKIVDQYQPIT